MAELVSVDWSLPKRLAGDRDRVDLGGWHRTGRADLDCSAGLRRQEPDRHLGAAVVVGADEKGAGASVVSVIGILVILSDDR